MNARFFSLDARLAACAEMLSGRAMADIGTDHAYLPVWAVAEGLVPCAVAADINEGPLLAAKQHVEKYHLEDKIALRLSDGLSKISSEEAEDFVLAGMGGELIARILDEAPWIKNPQKRLILQPMSKEEVLRAYLRQHCFKVERERAVFAGGKVYTVMQVSFAGAVSHEGELFELIGLLKGKTEEERAYIKKKMRGLEKKLPYAEEKEKLLNLLDRLRRLTEE